MPSLSPVLISSPPYRWDCGPDLPYSSPYSLSEHDLLYPEVGQSGDDLFSPSHWARDGQNIYPDEVDATLDELKNAMIYSRDLGKENFIEITPPDSEIQQFLEKTELYNSTNGRWTDVPHNPTSVRYLYKPMRAIIDAVTDYFDYASVRPVIDSLHIPDDDLKFDQRKQRPSVNRYKPLKRLPHFMAVGREGSNFGNIPTPFESGPSYAACISPLELQINVRKNFHSDLVQLTLYARQCFMRQHNRRFVYCLLVTESTANLYAFDRCGVCYSQPYNIHSDPVGFVRMILGIWSRSNSSVGFDTSVYWKQDEPGKWNRYINNFDENGEPCDYLLTKPFPTFDRWFIKGRGTTCWTTMRNGESLLIKDVWRDVSRCPESMFYRASAGIKDIGQMVQGSKGIKVSELRKYSMESTPSFEDRVFNRVILKNYGDKSIASFHSRAHLLHGLRRAIEGHQRLWDAGILHGDISMDNILLTGNQGVLIDLDSAMWVDPAQAHGPVEYHNMGTQAYLSLNVLDTHTAENSSFVRDHLDDLESFYYLLSHICCTYTGPGKRLPPPNFIRQWEQHNLLAAAEAKEGLLHTNAGHQTPTPYFGRIFEDLLEKLRTFFARTSNEKKLEAHYRTCKGAPLKPWPDRRVASEHDYATVLCFIERALYELALERYKADVFYLEPVNTKKRARDEVTDGEAGPSSKKHRTV